MSGARQDDVAPMEIVTASYDGSQVTVTWNPFTEANLTSYLVTLLQVGVGMNNVPVPDPNAVSKSFGYFLKAGDEYQCWVTPIIRPGYPDEKRQSQIVPIPYPPVTASHATTSQGSAS